MQLLSGPIDGVYDVFLGTNLREALSEAYQIALLQQETISVRFNADIIVNFTPDSDVEQLYQVYIADYMKLANGS